MFVPPFSLLFSFSSPKRSTSYTKALSQALTFASLSIDQNADICWEILQRDAVCFAALKEGDSIFIAGEALQFSNPCCQSGSKSVHFSLGHWSLLVLMN